MIVTLADLQGDNNLPRACGRFIEQFASDIGESSTDVAWTLAAQMLMLADPFWRGGWGWAVQNGYVPAWSMSRADLSRADLSGANLSDADLSKANLSGANLNRADLHRADLSGAKWDEGTIWPAGFAGQTKGE